METNAVNTLQVEVNEEGFLVNPDDWNEEIAIQIAMQEGINELTGDHWKIIHFMRKDFKERGQIPTFRRLKNAGGIPIQDIYKLFPEGPAKKAAKISGLGKPQGCV